MISAKLQKIIQIKEKKQTDIAKYLGISPSRVSNYISGKREPDYLFIIKMAKYFNVDMNYFSDEIFDVTIDYEDNHSMDFISDYSNSSQSDVDISLLVVGKLQQIIQKKEIRHADIAKYLDISASRLSNYISGKRDLKYHMLAKIAKYLDVDMNYFFDEIFTTYFTEYEDSETFFASENKDSNDIIHIPFLKTFSNKNDIPYSSIPFAKSFLPEITDKEKANILAINLDIDSGIDKVLANIIIVCVNIDHIELIAGNKIIAIGKGQTNRFFNYFEDDNGKLLVDHKLPENNIRLDDVSDRSGFYKILCQFEKFH